MINFNTFIAYDDTFLTMVTTFSNYFFISVVTNYGFSSSNIQMKVTNDQQDIAQVLSGNTNAFAILVNRYKDLVFTLGLQMLKNKEEAEEVSQDTFLKVYKKLNSFKGDSKFSTWVYRIAYNTCLDRLKSQKRQRQNVTIDEFTEHEIKTLENALDTLEQQERQEIIKNCLSLLPSEDSVLMTLFYFEEQSLKEISKITGVKVNNLKVKLFRARKMLASILRTKLEPQEIERYERKHG
ncbi:RNA polymerase sigma-70 factor (ECF subfamily) [Saonia flava]|uniref:RNA polymerase sigma-70 factor (ECF subfamily) n=1 Tax=Saonia flava TaxID=523696 RepID=A0A846QPK5_9FLAO|nr:RNA polymerase sigma factor [Saonia flava]NJB69991.1 RNA polymerase sigma-70 factor (ECF subfamily) [Saonia flava]